MAMTVSVPHSATQTFVPINFPKTLILSLRPLARARDCSVEQLVVQLVEVAADDQLIGAILDD